MWATCPPAPPRTAALLTFVLTLPFVVAALLVFAGLWVGRPRQVDTETTAGAALRSRYPPPFAWGRGLVLAAPRGHHTPWLPGSHREDP